MVSSAPTLVQLKDKIDLTEKDRQIFELLLQVVRHFNLQTQLRVAGGWVRDKLLGEKCDDIDIALDNMKGQEFCEKINEYLLSIEEEEIKIGVIARNPDQSKHLETAKMPLFGIYVDFVNLRSENYWENSRIPTMKLGTPEEDAYRRDLTINSLFYNVNKDSIEDFTGRGIADLRFGRIVTPLPPKDTFMDDPLRVFRAIRFGARFKFLLDEELKKAAVDNEVKVAIANKVKRERIGREIDLMISGNQPFKAMFCIHDLELFWMVFSHPHNCKPAVPEGYDRICIRYMNAAWNLLQLIGWQSLNDDQRRLYFYGALFLPLRKFVCLDDKASKIPLIKYIFMNSLKLQRRDAEKVINLHNASERFRSLIPFIITSENSENVEADYTSANLDEPISSRQRIMAGFLLREIKEYWRVALLMAMLIYPKDLDQIETFPDGHVELGKSKELYQKAENMIIELGLDNVWEMKPLVNGEDIMGVLQLKTGGPIIKEWQQKLLELQLAHPSTTAEECLNWMKQIHSKRTKLIH